MGTQKTTVTVSFSGGRVGKPGTGGLMVLAPRHGSANVAANVVKAYRTEDAVDNDHFAGSDLSTSAFYVRKNISRWFMGSFANAANAALGSRTFGAAPGPGVQTFTLPATETHIHELTSVAIDGTAVSRIHYTGRDPATIVAPELDDTGNGEVWFNPILRKGKTSRASSGVGAGIVVDYSRANLQPLFNQMMMRPIEVVTFGGNWRYNGQYLEMWSRLVAFAEANDLMVYAAMDDDVDPTSDEVAALAAAIRSDSFQVLALRAGSGFENDDATVAYAALQARSDPDGTLKDQPAPRGLTFDRTLPYTIADFGDDVDPAVDTFHNLGINCVTLSDDGGTFIISSDRCMTDYSTATDVLFGGVRRTVNATMALVKFEVNKVITNPKAGAKFDQLGLAIVAKAYEAGLTQAVTNRWVRPDFILSAPEDVEEDTEEVDRKKRTHVGVFIDMGVINPIQTSQVTVEVTQ